jgi:hypothetical protein
MSTLIDVWDTGTFDQELMATLVANKQLIRDYLTTDRRQFEEREAADRWLAHATNPYASDYMAFVEAVGHDIMQLRTIRAWHYTRLVDDEVRIIQENGICPGTLETLNLAGWVNSGWHPIPSRRTMVALNFCSATGAAKRRISGLLIHGWKSSSRRSAARASSKLQYRSQHAPLLPSWEGCGGRLRAHTGLPT